MMTFGLSCYWRFRGQKAWRYGYPILVPGTRLIRMGSWNGDMVGGTIVDRNDIEVHA